MSRWHSCVQLEPDSMHIVNPTNIGYKCQKKKKTTLFSHRKFTGKEYQELDRWTLSVYKSSSKVIP